MANNSRKVVLRKPKLDMTKQIDVRPRAPEQKSLEPEKKKKPVEKSIAKKQVPKLPEPIQDEIEIDGPEEEVQEIIKTSSPNKTIIVKKDPVVSKDTIISEPQTFDEKFLDTLDIKSRITKDEKLAEKLKKPELKPTIKNKVKEKKKRKFRPFVFISLLAFA
jgi:hypothetical protein